MVWGIGGLVAVFTLFTLFTLFGLWNWQLRRLVGEQTKRLEEANKTLEMRVAERTREVQVSEARYRSLFNGMPCSMA